MPLSRPALTLGADPRAPQEARRWVASVCEELGRDDLVECAELGVSELVTNALLHAGAPIHVRVRGTAEHPRVEVSDSSHEPPTLSPDPETEADELMSTFGRGLRIVARCSIAWGAAIEPEGKVVWFEPTVSPHHDTAPEGALFDLSELGLALSDPEAGQMAPILFENVPVDPLLTLRRHYRELRREVRLLSLAHEEDYPLAKTLTDVFAGFDQAYPNEITHQVSAAVASGADTVDLDLKLDPTRVAMFEQMLTLLELADEFCRGQRLLSLARSPEQVAFQEWFLGEFVRQAHGEQPRPWTTAPLPRLEGTEPRSATSIS